MKDRIYWIDILKGILLIPICIGHFGNLPKWVLPFITPTSMFYVPIFFMLSGYLLTIDGRSFKDFARRKIETLFIPYVFFSIIFIVFDWNTWLHPITDLPLNLRRSFIQGIGVDKSSPLWFVMALFLGEILCYPILHKIRRVSLLVVVIFILSVCAFGLSLYMVRLPWQIHLLPSIVTFMLSGYLLRMFHHRVRDIKTVDILTVVVFLGGNCNLYGIFG